MRKWLLHPDEEAAPVFEIVAPPVTISFASSDPAATVVVEQLVGPHVSAGEWTPMMNGGQPLQLSASNNMVQLFEEGTYRVRLTAGDPAQTVCMVERNEVAA